MKKNRISIILITVFLLCSNTIMVFAAPIENISVQISKIQQIDNSLSKNVIKIAENQNKIDSLKQEIEGKEKEIDILTDEIKEKKRILDSRIREMYKINYKTNFVMILLSSESILDFINNITIVKKVIDFDSALIEDLDKKEKQVVQDKMILVSNKNQIEKLNKENIQKQKELLTQKKNLMDILDRYGLSKGITQDAGAMNVQKILQNKYLTHKFPDVTLPIEIYNKKANLDFYSACDLDIPIKVTGEDIVMYAATFFGLPYVWGGNDLHGLDCSGYTKYVYKHFGIIIPRVAADQQHYGIDVKPDELQPGDLIFFDNPATHVAIYLNSRYMLEAPRTGDVIKISPIKPFHNAKRYVGLNKKEIQKNNNLLPRTRIQPSVVDGNTKPEK